MKLLRWSCPTGQDSAPISALTELTVYLPAHDVNTQTLCPFSPPLREKVYLLKNRTLTDNQLEMILLTTL